MSQFAYVTINHTFAREQRKAWRRLAYKHHTKW